MAQDIKIKLTVDGRDSENAVRRVSAEFAGLQSSVQRAAQASESATTSLARMGHIASTLAIANVSLGSIRQAVDSWASLNAQLQIATGSATAGAAAYREVLAIATQTGQSLEQVGAVYRRFAENATTLGLSLRNVADISRTVAQSIALSGGNAAAAEAALTQFGQALASGQLRGEELNSVLEQAPRLARALADGLGAPVGKLREMAQAGELTAERLVDALGKSAQQVSAEFERLPMTISAAMQNLRTSFTDAIGSVEQSTGAFSLAADGINLVAKNMGALANAATLLSGIMLGRYLNSLAAAKASTVQLAIAKQAALRAEVAYQQGLAATALSAAASSRALTAAAAAQAQLTTAATVARSALAALGGPIGLITTALSAGVTAWALWGNSADEATRKAAASARENIQSVIDDLTRLEAGLGGATRKQLEAGIQRAANTLTETALARDRIQRELSNMNIGDESMWSPSQARRVRELETEYQQLLAREKTLQGQITSLRDQSAQAGIDGVRAFVEANTVGAARIASQQEALRRAFDQTMQAAGGYNPANPEHVKALETLNVKLADLEKSGKKGASGAKAAKDEIDALGEAIRAWNKAEEERAKAVVDYNRAWRDYLGGLESTAQSLDEQIELYGLTEAQIARVNARRAEERLEIAKTNGAAADFILQLEKEVALRQRIATAAGTLEVREANRIATEQAADDWQRTADKIEDALIDALMDGGKSGAEYIESLFRTMVLRPIVQAIVQPIAGGITGALGFGAPGQGGTTASGPAGSINPMSFLSGNSIGMGYSDAAMWLAQSGPLQGTAAGNYLTGFAGNAGSYSNLAYGGAGIAGSVVGSLLFDGKGYSGAGGSIGAQIGLAAGGPIGAVVGTVLGSALGSFIGGGKPSDKTSWATYDPASGRATDIGSMTGKKDPGQEQRDATAVLASLVGGFAGIAGINSTVTAMIGGRDGTRLRINRAEGTQGFLTPQAGLANGGNALNYGNGEDAIKRMLDDLVDEGTLPQATIDAWRAAKTDMLGAARDATELVSTLNLLVAGYDTATIERANLLQAESEALEAALGRMLQIEAALTDTALPGDALAASAAEMARRLEALALGSVPTTTKALGELVSGLDLTTEAGRATYQSLMGLAPAFVEIQAAQKSLYDQLYTDEQRAANLAREVGDAFARLGVAMPATRDELRALIDNYDGSSAASAEMRAQLLGLVPAFVEVSGAAGEAAQEMIRAAERAAEEAARAIEAAENDLRAAYEREAGELRSTITRLDNFTRSLKDLKRELMGGALSPLDLFGRRAELARQFADASSRAASGDEAAIGELSGLTSEYLGVVQESAASAEDYYRSFAKVSRTLDATQIVAERELTTTKAQLTTLDQQVSALIKINDSVLSVKDAIAALASAQAAAKTPLTAANAAQASVSGTLDQIRAGSESIARDQWSSVQTASGAASVWASSGGALGVKEGAAISIYGKDGSTFTDFDAIDFVGNALAKGDEKAVYDAATRTGISAASLDTLMGWSQGTANAWAELNELPKFALGGYHPGGLRIVGEQGPELEVTGPARIYSADQTRAILGGGSSNDEMVRELRTLRAELAELKAASAATARSTSDTQRILSRVTNGGNAMLTETAA